VTDSEQRRALPRVLVDPENAWFRWSYYHEHEAEDPHAAWHKAWLAGGRAALLESGRIAELLPLLSELLMRWTDLDVEDEVMASDTREVPWSP
jgi:hypothetical protein